MILLALEFSTNQRSVALLSRQGVIAFKSEEGGRGKSGIALIAEILSETRVETAQISKIAVGLGPGSYTGVRSAIAIAQGWQLGRAVSVIGVSSVEVLARDAQKSNFHGEIEIIIDAQKNELYRARYSLDTNQSALLEALHLTPVTSIPSEATIVGPDAPKFITRAHNLFPRADTLGALAWNNPKSAPAEKLAPIYLREATFVKALHPSR